MRLLLILILMFLRRLLSLENLVKGLKDSTTTLGKIFAKDKEAKQLIADFDKSIEKAKSAYNGKDKVMSVIVTGGNIGFARRTLVAFGDLCMTFSVGLQH